MFNSCSLIRAVALYMWSINVCMLTCCVGRPCSSSLVVVVMSLAEEIKQASPVLGLFSCALSYRVDNMWPMAEGHVPVHRSNCSSVAPRTLSWPLWGASCALSPDFVQSLESLTHAVRIDLLEENASSWPWWPSGLIEMFPDWLGSVLVQHITC